jgi:hypothetical protein
MDGAPGILTPGASNAVFSQGLKPMSVLVYFRHD